mmetsp:Transcript_1714/g.3661  ORF Transcript_1714/g.3661 Transcript_1714/m.3661 type:complete len:463 (-) Transcript_1714:104-1492(-)|eukprot:CAMPEP_0172322650 /NCGR_PEP_ID=MMETSP1058-20130122/46502_1 /TAXON_ID=83371 /ORGANISM="Detonula confervacea, Strain CCMP 353" /LENGTH=462 /DNA_ID=CAMNT_0013038449 /DNA_START=210 /DNA_END=1598 /DNA_ORIENTATION=+
MSNAYNNRKRPFAFGATFRTLNNITNNPTHEDIGENDSASNSNSKITVQHIPSLPDGKEAAAILRRIHSEFHTIIERRGWNITSITEMCCCGDGVDCLKKRKTKVMPNNVLGYNRTSSSRLGNVHDIHLRLRHPRTHALVDYESIAGTMCHELAHCVRGPHDAKFYKAMEEIEEQYAVFLAKGVVVDKDGFPIGSNDAHTLGSGGTNGGKKSMPASDRRKALGAAESRRKKKENGFTLGGKSSSQKDPREAARIAAERRLLDSQYCLPCNEVIEILGEDSSDEESGDEVEVVGAVKNIDKTTGTKGDRGIGKQKEKSDIDGNTMDMKPKAKDDSTSADDVIDLTLDDSFTSIMSHVAKLKPSAKSKRKNNPKQTADQPHMGQSTWSCPRCTLSNPPIILVCVACRLERPCNTTVLKQAKDLKKEDDIAYIKEREIEQSKETFGGFNIYGEKKVPSSTMKHLT